MKNTLIGLLIAILASTVIIAIGWCCVAFIQWDTPGLPEPQVLRIIYLVFGAVGLMVGALSNMEDDGAW